MQKWEYFIFRETRGQVTQINNEKESALVAISAIYGFSKGATAHELINKLGQDGWELAGMGPDNQGGLKYVLKRPVT